MANLRTSDLAPLAMSMLASLVNTPNAGTQRPENVAAYTGQPVPPPSQQPRSNNAAERRTSHYNSFQTRCTPSTDNPPSYAVSEGATRLRGTPRHLDNGSEILPKYTCSVQKEGVMYMRIEKISPFQFLPKQEWRLVYVIVRGTQIIIHKVKTSRFGPDSLATAGRPIRSYTLQHAETGLAQDVDDRMLVAKTRLAHLIPAMARQKAYNKDPALFRSDKLFALRLRVETDQLLLAEQSEENIFRWTNTICAGIDVAYPIDERCLPKQSTVPRRRRRQRPQAVDNLQDRELVAEQERLLREMYPNLARSVEDDNAASSLQRMETVVDSPQTDSNLALTGTATNINNDQDAEDIDLSAMAEDGASHERNGSRPSTTRQTTASTVATSSSLVFTGSPMKFDAVGKWAPIHPHSASQQFRYVRRCMPVLLFDAPRCSNIVMCGGRRLHINHRMDMLEEWDLQPPTYDAHDFPSSSSSTTISNAPGRTTTRVPSVDRSSMENNGSDLNIRVVQSADSAIGGMDASLEKMHGSNAGKPGVQQARSTPQPHDKAGEVSPIEQHFPVLVGF